MTKIERIEKRLLNTLRILVGLHPRLAGGPEPGWTKELPELPAESFTGAPALAVVTGEFPEGDA